MLEQITPIILTCNEAPNIGRTLEQLRWARDIVVVDSFSDDETLDIVATFPRVRVYQRVFDDFAAQWSFALLETEIQTKWILGLDADFVLTAELVSELAKLKPSDSTSGYRAPLTYCINGRPLRHSLLPRLTVLYRRGARYFADGHTYRIEFDGQLSTLSASILHDDRKPFGRWFAAQKRYMELEAAKLLTAPRDQLDTADRIRLMRVIAPGAVFIYCLARGGILDGPAGLYYAWQRFLAECVLSSYLIEYDLKLRRIEARSGKLSGLIAVKPEPADLK